MYTQSGNENWAVSGFDDQGPAAVNGAVSMLVDDALQATQMLTFNSLQLWDVEQVEVYRGAQSTTQATDAVSTIRACFISMRIRARPNRPGRRGGGMSCGGAIIVLPR